VADIAADDAVLFLWTTNAHMREAFAVAEPWGFRYRTMLTWAKGRWAPEGFRVHMGVGDWLRGATEHALLCLRGQPKPIRDDVSTVLYAPRSRHSAKPQAFYDLAESMSPGPYCELFGRGMARLGWKALGDQVGAGGDIRDALAELVA
jgi:N6-adenosine-specific RNA methylase IME4